MYIHYVHIYSIITDTCSYQNVVKGHQKLHRYQDMTNVQKRSYETYMYIVYSIGAPIH